MRDAEHVLFARGGIDRAAGLRADADALARLEADPAARALPLWRGKALVAEAGASGGVLPLAWLPLDDPFLTAHGSERVFLGLEGSTPRFAVDVSGWEATDIDPDAIGRFADASFNRPNGLDGFAFAELRAQMGALDPGEAGLAATAKGVLGWHATHRYCARCGAPSSVTEGGWRRSCEACGGQHFPRTDPVVIMLITRGQSVLIGRQPGWPDGMYSLLAGFVEPGESIEAAVRRETAEEAGIAVGDVGYLASQPWPFPSSLMIGCHGEALECEIRRDPTELEAARWASREEILEGLAGLDPELRPARRGAIARFLLERWVADTLM